MRRFESMEDAEEAVKICQHIMANISSFKLQLPIIKNLTKDAILKKPTYWLAIVEQTGLTALKSLQQSINLNELVNTHHIMGHIEILEEICTRAEKEFSLEQKFNEEVVEFLKKKRLEYLTHKNTETFIISGVDEIMQLLDEKLTLLMVMKQNPNIKPIRTDVEKMEKKLRGYQDMFDSWVKCQRDWIYLEPIFSADGMEKELPDPTKWFREVDKKWRQVMNSIKEDNLIFENAEWEKLASTLVYNNELLDKVQKSLNTYLTSKREDFPRFYFLSDEELLEILSRAKEPTLVTKYIKKCFEGIDLIEFTKTLEVTKMISAEKEVVDFEKPIVTNQGDRKGRVEKWLTDLENMMRETLHKGAVRCAKDESQRVLESKKQSTTTGFRV
jgi:dynein heavy chain, axonemal